MGENIDKLEIAFRQGLELHEGVAVRDLEYRAIPEWDSIAHMALVAEIEEAFDIMLPTSDVLALSSFNMAVEIMKKHGVEDIG